MGAVATIGKRTVGWLQDLGDFSRFTFETQVGLPSGLTRLRSLRLLVIQMFEAGTRSIPVVMITGMFVGMVLAVQTVIQFKTVGLESQLGAVVNLSVIRELGPVLAGVLLAGRVGGGIAAELGTMRVTEQIDALSVMGADPVRHLVVPRYLACIILGPFLVMYADVMGVAGGYYIAVMVYKVNPGQYWMHSHQSIQMFDIYLGLIKAVFFGATISLISCYKAFRCEPGAAGVGRACTIAFVNSCIVILALDFFLNVLLNSIYEALYGVQSLLGG